MLVATDRYSACVLNSHLAIEHHDDGRGLVARVHYQSVRQGIACKGLLGDALIVSRQRVIHVNQRGHLIALEHELVDEGTAPIRITQWLGEDYGRVNLLGESELSERVV